MPEFGEHVNTWECTWERRCDKCPIGRVAVGDLSTEQQEQMTSAGSAASGYSAAGRSRDEIVAKLTGGHYSQLTTEQLEASVDAVLQWAENGCRKAISGTAKG